jgi:hypothetical protein
MIRKAGGDELVLLEQVAATVTGDSCPVTASRLCENTHILRACYAGLSMNFFGHATLAARFSDRPEFVLGAMLPDFSNMLGLRGPGAQDGVIAAGIRFHHVTDRAFHDLAIFRRHCREATAVLGARGVARGTARAVAHVGVELLLDAVLAEAAAARSAYVAGLRAGQRPELLRSLHWPSAEQARLGGLMSRLEGGFEEHRGVAQVPASLIVERLSRALGRRPRLAIVPRDLPAVGDLVELCHGAVVASTPALMSELTRDIERLWQ